MVESIFIIYQRYLTPNLEPSTIYLYISFGVIGLPMFRFLVYNQIYNIIIAMILGKVFTVVFMNRCYDSGFEHAVDRNVAGYQRVSLEGAYCH